MILTKREWNNGFYIQCTIGKKFNTSWWSAPPTDISHVDVSYLNERYLIIKTELRAKKFKELFKK